VTNATHSFLFLLYFCNLLQPIWFRSLKCSSDVWVIHDPPDSHIIQINNTKVYEVLPIYLSLIGEHNCPKKNKQETWSCWCTITSNLR